MNVTWDYDAPPPHPVPLIGHWTLEARPLSWFKNRHGLHGEKVEAAREWFSPKPGEERPPTLIPQAYDDGLLRDGHHRVNELKVLAKGHDPKIPVWILNRTTDVPTRKDPQAAPETQPAKAARFQAPAGGAIVNNQYLTGGRFLPRALKSIREVMALRKKRGLRKAESTARMAATTEPEKMIAPAIAAVGGAILRAGAAAAPRVAAGAGRAAAGAGRAGAGSSGGGGAMGKVGNVLSMIPSPQPARQDDQQEILARRPAAPKPSMGFTDVVKKRLLTPGTERKQLRDDEIRKIEDAHKMTDEERLVRSVHPKTGKVETTANNYYAWSDRLAKKRLGVPLHALLNDPGTSDSIKEAHLFDHIAHDGSAVLRGMHEGEASRWYGDSVRGWEVAMHHLFARERPGDPSSRHIPDHDKWGTYDAKAGKVIGRAPWMKLAKAVLAFTSGDAVPTDNAAAAARMIKSALRANPGNPFGHLPTHDHEGYREWQEKARSALGIPHGLPFEQALAKDGATKWDHIRAAWRWHQQHGNRLEALGVKPRYSQMEVLADTDGKPLARMPFKSGEAVTPWPGRTMAEVEAAVAAKKVSRVKIPNLGEDGHLKPTGWGKNSVSISAHAKRLGRVLAKMGGDEDAVVKFLDSRHPVAEIKKHFPGFSWDGEEPQSHGLGSFIFGPKFGRFYANVSGNKDEFTLDKWMARLAYSYLGAVSDAKKGRVEGPKSGRDARLIRSAFTRAASRLRLHVADLQAVMWDMVQRVPNLFGVKHVQDDFKIGGRKLLEAHGFDPGVVEASEAAPGVRSNASVGGGVPGRKRGGGGTVGRGGAPKPPPVRAGKRG